MTVSNVFATILLKDYYFCKKPSAAPQDNLGKVNPLAVNFMAKMQPVQNEGILQLDYVF